MAGLRRLCRRLVHAFRPSRGDADVAREVASHLALLEDEYQRRGLSPEDAHAEARKALGGVEQVRLAHRDARGFRWLDELRVDVRYAIRRLRHRPGASVLAVLMLALAVGLSTAMFTLVDKLLVRPVPFPHPEELAQLEMQGEHGGWMNVLPDVLRAWRDSGVMTRVEGATTATVTVGTDGEPIARAGATVSPGIFAMLGTTPIAGRLPGIAGDHREEVLVSETLWRTAFRADRDVIGRRIQVDATSAIVIGVLPRSFRFPEWNTDVWRVTDFTSPGASDRAMAYVRFAPNIPRSDALRVAADRAHVADPSTAGQHAEPVSLAGWAQDTYYQHAVPFLAGAVVLVAIVLCANVGSLLLTRLHARQREFGMCTALGASRGRLMRQALVESGVMGLAGAAIGTALAWALVTIAASVLPQPFLEHTLNPPSLDTRALLVAGVAGFIVTLAAGLLPAWLGTASDARTDDRPTERAHTSTRRSRMTTRGLLVGEVALASALLIGATVLARSFLNLSRIDRGFDPTGVVTMWILLDEQVLPTAVARRAASDMLEQELRGLAGVQRTAWSGGVPLSSGQIFFSDWTTDTPGAAPVHADVEAFYASPDYFDLYGIRLIAGRGFQPDDTDAVIIGERLAARLWPNANPVGHSFSGEGEHFHVVGLVKETRRSIVDADRDRADIYRPFTGRRNNSMLSLRCDRACPSEGVIRHRALAIPGIRIYQVTRLDEAFAQDLEQPRAAAALATTFAVLALLAAAGGLFGVLTYAVQQRRREFGIRASLGATPANIARVVFADGLLVGGVGLALGALLARALATTIASLQYGVTVFDPLSWLMVIAALAVTVAVALWQPARTAARTDPALLLRED
jgi:predicted permease